MLVKLLSSLLVELLSSFSSVKTFQDWMNYARRKQRDLDTSVLPQHNK